LEQDEASWGRLAADVERTGSNHACTQLGNPVAQTSVSGDDHGFVTTVLPADLDDRVVARAVSGDHLYSRNCPHAAGGALDYQHDLGIGASAWKGGRPRRGQCVAKAFRGARSISPPAIRYRTNHIRSVHDDQHDSVISRTMVNPTAGLAYLLKERVGDT
jgi:hypothetical protein